MGFRNWIIQKLVKKEMKKLNPSVNTEAADELLKRTLAQYTDTIKTAQKINKAKLLDVKTQQLKRELRESLEEEDDSDEEDEEEDDDEVTTIFKNVVLPLITKNQDKIPNLSKDKIVSFAQALPPDQLEDILRKLNLRD